ncbi:MAG: helix-hairpin-helix domain-containing protein [Flavobacteriales bacterium]
MTEQRRIISLLVLCVVLLVINRWVSNYQHTRFHQDPEIRKRLMSFVENISVNDTNYLGEADLREDMLNFQKAEKKAFRPFAFHPNHMQAADWERMGFSGKEAALIEKYKAKLPEGFQYKEQLSKVFCISEERYALMEPFIQLPDKERFFAAKYPKKPVESSRQEYAPKSFEPIELNMADTIELTKIKGIGPYFARNIYRYREKLGGFHRKEQLLEVYRFSDSLYQIVAPQIVLDTTQIKKMNVNLLEEKELYAHPYFRNGIARAIVNYRKQHGPFRRIEDLNKLHALDQDKISKIKPYLLIE